MKVHLRNVALAAAIGFVIARGVRADACARTSHTGRAEKADFADSRRGHR